MEGWTEASQKGGHRSLEEIVQIRPCKETGEKHQKAMEASLRNAENYMNEIVKLLREEEPIRAVDCEKERIRSGPTYNLLRWLEPPKEGCQDFQSRAVCTALSPRRTDCHCCLRSTAWRRPIRSTSTRTSTGLRKGLVAQQTGQPTESSQVVDSSSTGQDLESRTRNENIP